MESQTNTEEQDSKTYVQLSKAWYGEASLRGRDFIEEIHCLVGDIEFAFRWYQLDKTYAVRLEVYDDAFQIFADADVCELLRGLAHLVDLGYSGNPMPQAICELLAANGFEDATPTEEAGS